MQILCPSKWGGGDTKLTSTYYMAMEFDLRYVPSCSMEDLPFLTY